MPDENNIINTLLKSTPPPPSPDKGLRRYIADLNALIEAYKLKEQHHAAAVDLVANQMDEIEQLTRDLASAMDSIKYIERELRSSKFLQKKWRKQAETQHEKLEKARAWAAVWKAKAKESRDIGKTFARSVGRLTQRNAELKRQVREVSKQ